MLFSALNKHDVWNKYIFFKKKVFSSEKIVIETIFNIQNSSSGRLRVEENALQYDLSNTKKRFGTN